MSVLRQLNLLGQQRVDVPHVRSIESSIVGDFDLLAGRMMAGLNSLVLTGFEIVGSSGGQATGLQVNVAGATMMHPLASENGTIFFVPTNRTIETLNVANSRLSGSFTSSSVNYLGVDLRRSADSSTADLAQFLNPDTNSEKPEEIPLGRTLDYILVLTTQDFSTLPGIAPIAKITTDANNNVTAIEDARNFFFRLGSGGTVPNPQSSYVWPMGRTEVGNNSDFDVADKAIGSFKEWMDAAMTRMWELGGGEYWYSPTADRNVQLTRGFTGSAFSNGEWFEWTGTNLHWKSLKIIFDNSTGHYNDVADQTGNSAGLTDLADGECVYVDIDRSANRTGGTALVAKKGVYAVLGVPLIPGSRFILAWRVGSVIWTRDSSWTVGSTFFPATNLALGLVKLTVPSDTPATPVVPVVDVNFLAAVRGISRTNLGGNLGSGALSIGQGANDSSISAGKSGATAAFLGVMTVAQGATVTGTGSGTGVDATGGATGKGIVTHEVASNDSDQIQTQNSAGVRTGGFDHIGFPAALPEVMFRENWLFGIPGGSIAAYGQLAAGNTWAYQGNNQGTPFIGNVLVGSTFPYPGLNIECGNATNNNGWVMTGGSVGDSDTVGGVFYTGTAAVQAVMEWTAAIQTLDATTWNMGWTDSSLGPYGRNLVVGTGMQFRKVNADASWRMVTSDGATETTTITSSPVLVNGVYHKFRIEYHASGSPYGAPTVRYFIDGVLLATHTTHVPVTSPVRIAFGGTRTTNVSTALTVGPVYCAVKLF